MFDGEAYNPNDGMIKANKWVTSSIELDYFFQFPTSIMSNISVFNQHLDI